MKLKDSILLRLVILYLGLPVGFYLILTLTFNLLRMNASNQDFEKPDDVKIARAALAEKFVGPRYFHVLHEIPGVQAPEISVKDARSQVAGIAAARKLDSHAVEKIGALVEALSEPAPSRLVGEDCVNVLQLNLALDELK